MTTDGGVRARGACRVDGADEARRMACRGVHFTLRADEDDRLLAARDDDFDYTWSNLQDPCAFFAKAAAAGRSVVFTVSQ